MGDRVAHEGPPEVIGVVVVVVLIFIGVAVQVGAVGVAAACDGGAVVLVDVPLDLDGGVQVENRMW